MPAPTKGFAFGARKDAGSKVWLCHIEGHRRQPTLIQANGSPAGGQDAAWR
jgi:hypothetical protein